MPKARPAGPYPFPDIATESWLVRFDKNGVCTSPQTRVALLDRLAASKNSPVLFFSHGWNNDFADAVDLYRRFLTHFEKVLVDYPVKGPTPIFVGVTWPSMWLPSDEGPQMASAAVDLAESSARDRVLRELLETLPAGTNWPRLYELMEAERLSEDEAREFAVLLKPALPPTDDGPEEAAASVENILKTLRNLQATSAGGPASENLDDFGTVGGAGSAGTSTAPDAAGLFGFLDPRWALRLTSLYIMKDRAGTVGWGGVGALLRDMLVRSSAPIHAVGHSYGGKVMLSALAAPGALSRKVQSLLLLQPAVSHLSFSATVPGRSGPGGYRSVLDRVAGPIFSTFSAHDFPLHTIYHQTLLRRDDLGDLKVAATLTQAGNPPNAYAALGGYGPRGADEDLIEPIPGPGEAIKVAAGKHLVGLDGSQFNRIDGHGGVANPYTAWALRTQMTFDRKRP